MITNGTPPDPTLHPPHNTDLQQRIPAAVTQAITDRTGLQPDEQGPVLRFLCLQLAAAIQAEDLDVAPSRMWDHPRTQTYLNLMINTIGAFRRAPVGHARIILDVPAEHERFALEHLASTDRGLDRLLLDALSLQGIVGIAGELNTAPERRELLDREQRTATTQVHALRALHHALLNMEVHRA